MKLLQLLATSETTVYVVEAEFESKIQFELALGSEPVAPPPAHPEVLHQLLAEADQFIEYIEVVVDTQ